MIYRFLLFIFLSSLLAAEEQELVVRLETDNRLTPVQLIPIEAAQSALPKDYVRQLEEVLRFDLGHNGATQLTDKPVFYRIACEVKEHHISVRLFSSDGEEDFRLGQQHLSGYLSEDRKIIHRIADAIHRALFGADGIASTRLLYTVRTVEEKTEYSEIWQSDYDGANAMQLTSRQAGYCITPGYVPHLPGKQAESFFYVSYKTGIPKVYIASLGEPIGRKMLTLSGNQLMPAINRQRDRIAFISDVTGNPDLFIQEFSPEKGGIGKPRHLFSARYATQGSPTFSPDGFRLAFVSNKGGSPRVYLMNIPPQGTPLKEIEPILVTKVNRENTAPCWSPDGTKLAYCSKTKGVRQIWVYDLLTGVERQLTDGPRNKENPSWASNSLHIVYNTSDAGNCELYLINLKQAKAVKITSGAGEKRFPSWEL
ncbi:Tol-Pal system protein TolB [Waddlia chondrophila]|nr:Tol-Pal system protein TolB [Waddlia chondrophila]